MFLVYSDYFCCTGTYAANSYWVRSIKKLSSFWKEIFPNQCDFKEWARHTNVFKCLKNNRTLVNTFYWKQTKQQPKSKETLNLIDSFCLRIYPSIILPIHSIFIGHTLSYLLRSLVKNSLFLSLYKAKIPIQQSCDRVNTNTVGIQSSRKWVPCGDRRIMSISAHYSFPDLYSHSSVKCLNQILRYYTCLKLRYAMMLNWYMNKVQEAQGKCLGMEWRGGFIHRIFQGKL